MSASASSALKVSEAAPLFAALGDETRLKLVSRLSSEGPLSIVRLSEGSDVTRQAITKHLRALADAGVVHDTRKGRERIWELRPQRLEKARQHLHQISQQWDAALGRLQDFLRDHPE
ncbi:MAG TPA: metalloregulator ArsR/SmtB family transcription factor [Polyangiaceae bacterium]|nr:metalloregulator ArsR/SmtB family transcription factor [Polyangiaceae bacterium]